MKKKLLSLLLALCLCAGLTVLPASAVQVPDITAHKAIFLYEQYLENPHPSPDENYSQYAGHFFIDLDNNGIPELAEVYYGSNWGDTILRFHCIDYTPRATRIGGDFFGDQYFYSSIGGSGGVFGDICRQSDGSYRLAGRMHYDGTDESIVMKFQQDENRFSGKFVATSDEPGESVFNLSVDSPEDVPDPYAFFPKPEPPKMDPVAYPSTQTVTVNGVPVEFQMYALKDANGNDTNYIKARDLAFALSDTDCMFAVEYYNDTVYLEPDVPYTPNGSEMTTPFSGSRAYTLSYGPTWVEGVPEYIDAIILTDDAGGGYTYYKLRDLGYQLQFTVDWSPETGATIDTDRAPIDFVQP